MFARGIWDEEAAALAAAVRIGNMDDVLRIAEAATDRVSLPIRRDARLYDESVIVRPDAENKLRDGISVPCGSTRQPAVLALAGLRRILACNHLRVHIGLHLV